MKIGWLALSAAALCALASPAFGQSAEVTPSSATAAVEAPVADAAFIRIPAGTEVQVELTEALSSRTSQREQLFALRLAEPIVIDGREVVPAGAPGGGDVIDAHASAFGGRQGRLIISGRYVEINGQRQRIRGMQIMSAGEQRTNTALAVSMIPYAGVAGIFVQGGEVNIPVGARGTARLASDVDVPLTAIAAMSATQADQATPVSEGEDQ
jgi:hypothetical protein